MKYKNICFNCLEEAETKRDRKTGLMLCSVCAKSPYVQNNTDLIGCIVDSKEKFTEKQRIILIAIYFVICFIFLFFEQGFAAERMKEADFVNEHCKGSIEYVLQDKTRCDCLTDGFSFEYDFAKKWYEALGQSLHYARLTGKTPGIVLIKRRMKDQKYINSCKALLKDLYKNYNLYIYLKIIDATGKD